MTVSAEIVTMIATGATLLVAFIGGFGWMINRFDARMDARFDKVESRLDRVEQELTEVKVAVARLEGPPRHLITTTR
ncbi:hypothetical protein [Microbacterium sp. NIBRBAC000506063]|uniref:hypothetical protein n=1 Tax=Microbacterium sp. NIBRBAC000506063 TaxID=2734618 RepID=UPI001BB793BA|nr:hypothetical protein [Microbacterium sp. NIBRBAC000506063]QTV80259.1 hypothetical protein KAE78_04400 [Microbacterium sp. NIBRBAC000506063]